MALHLLVQRSQPIAFLCRVLCTSLYCIKKTRSKRGGGDRCSMFSILEVKKSYSVATMGQSRRREDTVCCVWAGATMWRHAVPGLGRHKWQVHNSCENGEHISQESRNQGNGRVGHLWLCCGL
jgi:hypothetical protein